MYMSLFSLSFFIVSCNSRFHLCYLQMEYPKNNDLYPPLGNSAELYVVMSGG